MLVGAMGRREGARVIPGGADAIGDWRFDRRGAGGHDGAVVIGEIGDMEDDFVAGVTERVQDEREGVIRPAVITTSSRVTRPGP